MPIINTVKNSKAALFTLAFLLLALLFGCTQKTTLEKPQDYIKQAENYYQQAIAQYQRSIAQGKDLDRMHLELGELYYQRGEFEEASGQLKKSNLPAAKKFLAISLYSAGNFTDALEVFNKNEISDDEYLYYRGLTCEKLNLFDKALDNYKKIRDKRFAALAVSRIGIIEKEVSAKKIKNVDPEIYRIIQASPSQEAYPQAGGLILLCDEKITITPQDTQVGDLHYLIKILNERGKEEFSETQIEYDSTDEKVELIYARTIKPDGTVTDVGTRHIRDVSKYLNFPLYSNVRIFIISFPEIAAGAVIEYKLKIHKSELINKKDFILNYPLQTSQPIIAANFFLDLPKTKSLHLRVINEQYNNFAADLKPKIRQENGRLIYSWQFRDIPQIIPEPNMPAGAEINPTLLLSTFNSWEEIYRWWWSLAGDKIKADSAIKDKVSELIRKQGSPEEKARAIYNYCAKEIRYVAVEYGQAGYEPHRAELIFKNKYGDCKDQAVLLVTMLKEAGFPAWLVLISTRDYYNLNPDFPCMLFNHVIAAVKLKDKIIFLDPTAETCSFGDLPADDQQRTVLVFKEDKFEIENTPLYSGRHNLIKQELDIHLKADETITARKNVLTFGIYDQGQRYWLLYTPPQLISEVLKEKIQDISIGAKLEGYQVKNLGDLNQPVALSYSFLGPEYCTVAGNLRIMPQLAALDTGIVAKEKRVYPVDFALLDSKETILNIGIPGNFALKYIPDNVNEENRWLKFSVEYRFRDNKIYFRQNVELKKKIILESEYPEFKAFFEKLAKQIKQRIILEKIK